MPLTESYLIWCASCLHVQMWKLRLGLISRRISKLSNYITDHSPFSGANSIKVSLAFFENVTEWSADKSRNLATLGEYGTSRKGHTVLWLADNEPLMFLQHLLPRIRQHTIVPTAGHSPVNLWFDLKQIATEMFWGEYYSPRSPL